MARRRRPTLVRLACRRGCGKTLHTLSAPIHNGQADFDRLHGICDDCLTQEERDYMAGPMLLATAKRIAGRST